MALRKYLFATLIGLVLAFATANAYAQTIDDRIKQAFEGETIACSPMFGTQSSGGEIYAIDRNWPTLDPVPVSMCVYPELDEVPGFYPLYLRAPDFDKVLVFVEAYNGNDELVAFMLITVSGPEVNFIFAPDASYLVIKDAFNLSSAARLALQ